MRVNKSVVQVLFKNVYPTAKRSHGDMATASCPKLRLPTTDRSHQSVGSFFFSFVFASSVDRQVPRPSPYAVVPRRRGTPFGPVLPSKYASRTFSTTRFLNVTEPFSNVETFQTDNFFRMTINGSDVPLKISFPLNQTGVFRSLQSHDSEPPSPEIHHESLCYDFTERTKHAQFIMDKNGLTINVLFAYDVIDKVLFVLCTE